MARSLNVKIVGDASSYQRALRSAQKDTSKLAHGFRALGTAAKIGLGAGLLGVGLAAKSATKELIDAQKVAAQTQAVIKSTGGIANVTAKHVDRLGSSILKLSGIDDEAIKSGENMLLTFKNIRNQVGQGNNIFDQATMAVTNMDVAMTHGRSTGESLSKTAIRIGKALQDPVKGSTALARVGVQFTEAQKKQLKALVDSGHAMEAQKLILRELTSEFGGSAKALGNTFAGRLNILRESLRNLGAELLSKLVPSLERLSSWLVGIGLPAAERFARSIDWSAILQSLRAPLQSLVGGLKDVGGAARAARNFLGPNLFAGLVVGIVGAAGALKAVQALRTEMLALAALGAGTGPVALAFAGLAITIGGLAAIFLHNRTAANQVADAYDRWAQSARDLKNAQESLKQSQLDVEQAHIRQKLAADSVVEAQRAYNQAVRDFGPRSQEAISSLHNLQQAKHDQRQADLDAVKAVQANADKQRELRTANINTTKAITDAAQATRNHQNAIGALMGSGVLRKLSFGLSTTNKNYETGAQKAEIFAQKAERIAAAQKKLNPRLSATATAMAALARAIDAVPSDLTIRFIVKTLSFTPGRSPQGGPFQGGGHAAGGRIAGARTMADSVPAMLSPGEFVVTGGGERMLESMTFPGVLNWLQTKQPRHFAGGGRVQNMLKQIEFDRLYQDPAGGGGASTHGLVGQVLRALAFARGHGWGGTVTSGFRSYAQQAALYARYLGGGPLAAKPGTSSHERGQAVDVSDYGSFGATMSRAPASSRLYNFLGARDPVHFSVSGYQAGGRVVGPTGRDRPRLDIPSPSPLAGLRRRIAALRAEERKLKNQIARVDGQIRQIDKTKKKTKAQVARRKKLVAESHRLHARLKTVQAQLVSLNQRVQEVHPARLQRAADQHSARAGPGGADRDQRGRSARPLPRRGLPAAPASAAGDHGRPARPVATALAGVRGDISSLTGAEQAEQALEPRRYPTWRRNSRSRTRALPRPRNRRGSPMPSSRPASSAAVWAWVARWARRRSSSTT